MWSIKIIFPIYRYILFLYSDLMQLDETSSMMLMKTCCTATPKIHLCAIQQIFLSLTHMVRKPQKYRMFHQPFDYHTWVCCEIKCKFKNALKLVLLVSSKPFLKWSCQVSTTHTHTHAHGGGEGGREKWLHAVFYSV